MKILCLNDYGYPFGGAEIFALEMAEALRARGHEIRWLTSRSRGGGTLATVARGARPFHDDYFARGATGLARGVQQICNLSARAALRRALREWRPDVVHLHGYLGRLSPAVIGVLADYPTIATLHNYRAICPKGTKARPDGSTCASPWGAACVTSGCLCVTAGVQETVKRAIWGAPLAGIDRLLAPSRFMGDVVRRETGRAVDYHPLATSIHALRREKIGGGGVLYAGRLAATKGIDILIEAARRIGAPLTIAGEGPARREAPGVRYVGVADRAKLAELHAHADVMALPATWPENAPVSILESHALGTPVVASRIGGIPELISDGVDGALVPPGDVGALARALEQTIKSAGEMHHACLARAESYHLSAAAERLETIYQSAQRSTGAIFLPAEHLKSR